MPGFLYANRAFVFFDRISMWAAAEAVVRDAGIAHILSESLGGKRQRPAEAREDF
jgi:hypothetical protein